MPSDLCFFVTDIAMKEEGNGNPLQYSYLENPRDRGTWWAIIYGVTQSQTRLKQLSSSSSIAMKRTKIFSFQSVTLGHIYIYIYIYIYTYIYIYIHTHIYVGMTGWLILCVSMSVPGCLCKRFWMILTFKLVNLSEADYFPSCEWALSNQLKALVEKRLTFPKQERILSADWLWTWTTTSPESPVCKPSASVLNSTSLHNNMSHFLQMNLSIYTEYINIYINSRSREDRR